MYVSVAFQGQKQSNAALLSRQYIFLILLLAVEERGKLSMNTIIYMSRVGAPHHPIIHTYTRKEIEKALEIILALLPPEISVLASLTRC